MGIAILNRARHLVVAIIAVYHQNPWQLFFPQDFFGHAGSTALAKPKDTDIRCAKQPGETILAISTPTRLVSVFDWRFAIGLYQ